ncbi:MAG TPA: cupredoxin domain-containing protein [Solirubrobacteraceae bacterium]|jgi:plastocyanin|nr:cupredoxin domain-containing protein [Solirubrobacteraceae bacterium]
MTKRTHLILAAALVAAAAGGTVGGLATAMASQSAPRKAVVTLHNVQFHPGVVHLAVGGTVTWRWEDADIDTEHNVTSIGAARFKSSRTQQNGTYTLKFNKAGVYRFECTIHPQSMQGKIVVG